MKVKGIYQGIGYFPAGKLFPLFLCQQRMMDDFNTAQATALAPPLTEEKLDDI